MVEDIHGIGGTPSSGGEGRKTTARREVLEAMRGEEMEARAAERVSKAAAAGSALDSMAGAAASALGIIAMTGTYPMILSAIGFMAVGGALLLGAGGLAAILGRVRGRGAWAPFLLGGASFEALAGAAGVACGILALVGVVPMTLLPVAAIVLGTCLILSADGFYFLRQTTAGRFRGAFGAAAADAAVGASGGGILAGLGSITLGVLALAGIDRLLLTEISVLTLGGGMLVQGAAQSGHWVARMAGR